MNNTEKCKALAGWIGVCWHSTAMDFANYEEFEALLGACKWCGCLDTNNPDYYTAEGRQVLLEWAVEREWWVDFEAKYSISLFIPVTTFADAVYEYLKERGNEQIR